MTQTIDSVMYKLEEAMHACCDQPLGVDSMTLTRTWRGILEEFAAASDADSERLNVLEREALRDAITLHDGLEPMRRKMSSRGLGFGVALKRSLRDAIDQLGAHEAVPS